LAFYFAAHSVIFGLSRMHFPLVPVLALAVAGVFCGGNAGLRSHFWRRGTPWFALVLAGWLVAAPVQAGLYLAPSARHVTVARLGASLRDLPLPGTRYLSWMLATLEGSRGNLARADQILAEPRHAEHPWSLYLRGRLASDEDEAARWLSRALERDPDLFAARATLGRLLLQRAEWDAGIDQLERALAVRPWDSALRSDLRTAVRMRGQPALE
jgi:tetratricopeptide (TPR) repeat protein